MSRLWVVLVVILVTATGGAAQAAVIGNWSSSSRSWNSSDMATLKAALVAAGHTVRPDAAISAGELAACQVFVIGEGTAAPVGVELTQLTAFVNGGGILLVFTNSGASGVPAGNAMFAALGSTLLFGGGSPSLAPFPAGPFTNGPPHNIVGQSLATSPGNDITGGTALAGSYAAFQQIGAGYVVGFGDRFDHNTFNPNASTPNGQLFLNIAAVGTTVPAMPTAGLIALGLLLALVALAMGRRGRLATA